MNFLKSKLTIYTIAILMMVGVISCKKGKVVNVGNISGPTTVCYGDTGVEYSINQDADYILWKVPEQAQIISGQGKNKIKVNFGRKTGKICVNLYNNGEQVSVDSCLEVNFDVSNRWCREMDFKGGKRGIAFCFSIGNKGYLGSGIDNLAAKYNDLWEFDPAENTWTQKRSFVGAARIAAVAFSIGNKGYMGTGSTGLADLKDFWEYDPSTNQWSVKDSVPGLARKYAFGFSIGNKGYIGSGGSGIGSYLQSDFYEYDPATGHWTSKADVAKREGGAGFSIGNKGYLGMGRDGTGSIHNELWEYDPSGTTNGLAIGSWTQIPGPILAGRSLAVGFSIGNKGYISTGFDGNIYHNDFWEFTPLANTWVQKPDLAGGNRAYAIGFSIGNKGYIGTGSNGINPLSDFWVYVQ